MFHAITRIWTIRDHARAGTAWCREAASASDDHLAVDSVSFRDYGRL
jgi:hypothetical protein